MDPLSSPLARRVLASEVLAGFGTGLVEQYELFAISMVCNEASGS